MLAVLVVLASLCVREATATVCVIIVMVVGALTYVPSSVWGCTSCLVSIATPARESHC